MGHNLEPAPTTFRCNDATRRKSAQQIWSTRCNRAAASRSHGGGCAERAVRVEWSLLGLLADVDHVELVGAHRRTALARVPAAVLQSPTHSPPQHPALSRSDVVAAAGCASIACNAAAYTCHGKLSRDLLRYPCSPSGSVVSSMPTYLWARCNGSGHMRNRATHTAQTGEPHRAPCNHAANVACNNATMLRTTRNIQRALRNAHHAAYTVQPWQPRPTAA